MLYKKYNTIVFDFMFPVTSAMSNFWVDLTHNAFEMWMKYHPKKTIIKKTFFFCFLTSIRSMSLKELNVDLKKQMPCIGE